ncbi:MAG: class I SAM-dependent methyltransferase, partial [Chloroflexi bacterium]|nr:class I SAM-dependent methyltransferase [Chloroflexota bacterium]
MRRGAERLLQPVGAVERSGAVHAVGVEHGLRDVDPALGRDLLQDDAHGEERCEIVRPDGLSGAGVHGRRRRVLEVGVGTGLSLPDYAHHLEIVGIDLSPEMLKKARERVGTEGLENVTGLHEMDAADLTFPADSFNTVVAMFVMTVVPDPERVMRELARVTK